MKQSWVLRTSVLCLLLTSVISLGSSAASASTAPPERPANASVSTASFDVAPTRPMSGEIVHLEGRVPSGQAARPVTVEQLRENTWTPVAQAETLDSAGTVRASFSATVSGPIRLAAPQFEGLPAFESDPHEVTLLEPGWTSAGCEGQGDIPATQCAALEAIADRQRLDGPSIPFDPTQPCAWSYAAQMCHRGSVRWLNIGYDVHLYSLSPLIADLPHLNTLGLEETTLAELPREIGDLPALVTLRLSDNRLAEITPSVGSLPRLKYLHLDNNRLKTVPAALGRLSRLKSLLLEDNALTSIPASLGDLTEMTDLRLNSNRLTKIPASLGKLRQLPDLDLHRNRLTKLPRSVNRLSRLRELDLTKNRFTKVPPVVATLKKLESLDLSKNPLTKVSPSLVKLTRLDTLRLNSLDLTKVPPVVRKMKRLYSLMLINNKLTSVPRAVGKLPHLQRLYLTGNRLKGDISPWARPLFAKTEWPLHKLGLRGNRCLNAGGDRALARELTWADEQWRDGC